MGWILRLGEPELPMISLRTWNQMRSPIDFDTRSLSAGQTVHGLELLVGPSDVISPFHTDHFIYQSVSKTCVILTIRNNTAVTR